MVSGDVVFQPSVKSLELYGSSGDFNLDVRPQYVVLTVSHASSRDVYQRNPPDTEGIANGVWTLMPVSPTQFRYTHAIGPFAHGARARFEVTAMATGELDAVVTYGEPLGIGSVPSDVDWDEFLNHASVRISSDVHFSTTGSANSDCGGTVTLLLTGDAENTITISSIEFKT